MKVESPALVRISRGSAAKQIADEKADDMASQNSECKPIDQKSYPPSKRLM